MFSPASIKTLLALILEGSEGSTQAELLRVLRLPQNMTYARRALSSLQNSLQVNKYTVTTIFIEICQKYLSSLAIVFI